MTPRFFSASVSDCSLFKAPLTLKEPVFWKDSSFSRTFTPVRSLKYLEPTNGVLWTCPSRTFLASKMSCSVIQDARIAHVFSSEFPKSPRMAPLMNVERRIQHPSLPVARFDQVSSLFHRPGTPDG